MAIFSGTMMDDILRGTPDMDVLWGGMGDDDIQGGAGNDRLIGGPGGDALNGGPGMDIASYTMSPGGVRVDLQTSFTSDVDERPAVRGGDAEGDSLTSIEALWGSAFGDIFHGNHSPNYLFGNAGDDIITGRGGNDLVRGGADNDQLSGNDGDDIVYGDEGGDQLNGGMGNDMLFGGMGDDELQGNEGDDVLEGGPGADMVFGGTGDEKIGDTAAYTMSPEAVMVDLRYPPANPGARPPVNAPMGGDAAGDMLDGIENLRGSMHDDTLIGSLGGDETDDPMTTPENEDAGTDNRLWGNQGDDKLMGMAGHDMLYGGKGNDTLYGGSGNDKLYGQIGDDALKGEEGADTLVGGPGADKLFGDNFNAETMKGYTADDDPDSMNDTADYSMSDAGVTIDLGKTTNAMPIPTGEGGHAEGDELVAIEHLTGSMHDDMLTGTNPVENAAGNLVGGKNTLKGMDGDDMLSGMGGMDDLQGGKGDDTLNGGAGVDELTGGAGDDVFVYRAIDDRPVGTTDDTDTTQIDESMVRDTDWADTTEGEIDAASGRYVRGESPGDMMVNGGTGMDTIDASGATGSVYVNLNVKVVTNEPGPGAAASGTDPAVEAVTADYAAAYTSIEKVIGGAGSDMLTGNSKAPTYLMGGTGNDSLVGGDGSDTLAGGAGSDTLSGGSGDDTFVYSGGTPDPVTPTSLVGDTITDLKISARGASEKIDISALALSASDVDSVLRDASATASVADVTILHVTSGGEDVQGTYIKFGGTTDDPVAQTDYDLFLRGVSGTGSEELTVDDFILG